MRLVTMRVAFVSKPTVRSFAVVLILWMSALHAVAQFEETQGDGDSVQRDHYLVLRAENTALQDFLVGKRQADTDYSVHLFVDGQALLDEERPMLERLDWEQLRDDLREVFGQAVIGNLPETTSKAIFIRTYFTAPSRQQDSLLNWTLEGFVRQSAGFDNVRLTSTYSGGLQWREKLDPLLAEGIPPFQNDADEEPLENDYVKVFPVRTFLSRLLTDNADCVIVVKPKFSDEFAGGLPRAIRTSMTVSVRQLDLERRHKVVFSFAYSHPQGEAAKDWFLEKGAREMQNLLEFQRSSTTIGHR